MITQQTTQFKLCTKDYITTMYPAWRQFLLPENLLANSVVESARKSNQSILKEINPEYSLEGLMLKLKLQYFGHLIRRADSLEKTLMVGKIEGGRRRGRQRMRWLDGITDSMDMSLSINSGSWWWTGRPGMLQFMGSQRVGHIWTNWTEEYVRACVDYFLCFCTSVGGGCVLGYPAHLLKTLPGGQQQWSLIFSLSGGI